MDRYARLLVQSGNYEGAVAALERLLINPQAAPSVRLDIAVLYYRMGSYAMAEAMLHDALQDRRLTPEQQALARKLLGDAQRRNQVSQIDGSVLLALRHQSNPTYRTADANVYSAGALGPLAPADRPQSDADATLGLRLAHVYDLQMQNYASVVSTLGAYWVDYRSSSGSRLQANPANAADLLSLEVTSGLRFRPLPVQAAGLSVRPHVLASQVAARQHHYLRSHGLGLDVSYQHSEYTLAELTIDSQQRSFANRIDLTDSQFIGGRLSSLRARLTHELAPGRVLVGELAARRNDTARDYYDFDTLEARVSYSFSYANPFVAAGRALTTSLTLSAVDRRYGAADPAIKAGTTRHDKEWRLGLHQSVPLSDAWAALLVVERARSRSSLPNFNYNNTAISGALLYRF